ncbi:MAG: NDP-sugar synthase [Candidatus Eremiobacteraeota bacterium]|nr:NDP-sugar synthase [Candidatus Eremiobacteraeota bacterium]
MKAMILAGGLSTRLYPLTKQVPKPLVPIAGEPNSGHVMRYLCSFGIEEVAINVHYLADKIVAAFGDGSRYGVKLTYLHEQTLLGSAGGVKQMEAFLGDDTFVVVGCDGLTDLRLNELIAFHQRKKALATIALVPEDDVSHYGVVVVDDDGRIIEFQEKPPKGTERSNLVNTGVYIFEPAIFERIPAGEFWDFGKNVFPELQREAAPFYALEMDGAYWVDIGTPGEYRQATNDVLSGKARLLGSARARGYPADAVLGRNVRLDDDVRIGSAAVLGDGVRVIGPSVIGDRVAVGKDATIEASILWDGATVGKNARLADSIIGVDYAIAPGASLEGVIVANE